MLGSALTRAHLSAWAEACDTVRMEAPPLLATRARTTRAYGHTQTYTCGHETPGPADAALA